ncbi:MAG: hypothetical protein RLZZ65_1525 [Bacteroidota bacterium]|jgi:hypothetical protein
MKPLLIFSLLLLTSCSYFNKEKQLQHYDILATDSNGNILTTAEDAYGNLHLGIQPNHYTLLKRTKEWLLFNNDTLYIDEHKNVHGKLHDFRPNQTHIFKFTGKIIDESYKTLHIKGEYFDYNHWTKEYFYYGVFEIF